MFFNSFKLVCHFFRTNTVDKNVDDYSKAYLWLGSVQSLALKLSNQFELMLEIGYDNDSNVYYLWMILLPL